MVFCFFFLKDFELVQQAVPMLDKWRYALASKFFVNAVFIVVVTYILMRLPVCNAFVYRGGGTSTKFILCKEQRCLFVVNG